jgi:aminomethyltransferase
MVTFDLETMKLWDARYSLICYPDGGVVDDTFIYRIPDPEIMDRHAFMVVVNASNRTKDMKWFELHQAGFDVVVQDISDETYMLAIQGPQAPRILDRIAGAQLTKVPRFTALQDNLLGDIPATLGRTGYTGEDGFELFFPADRALDIWETLLKEGADSGLVPVGLAARDSLRFEACMPLYGHEIGPDISPLEARLGFAVKYRIEFLGRDMLLKQKLEGTKRLLVGFEMQGRGVAREGYRVLKGDNQVGFVTSGMFTPTLGQYLGMAIVEKQYSKPGNEFDIEIRGKSVLAKVVKRPFYTPTYRL